MFGVSEQQWFHDEKQGEGADIKIRSPSLSAACFRLFQLNVCSQALTFINHGCSLNTHTPVKRHYSLPFIVQLLFSSFRGFDAVDCTENLLIKDIPRASVIAHTKNNTGFKKKDCCGIWMMLQVPVIIIIDPLKITEGHLHHLLSCLPQIKFWMSKLSPVG